MEMRFFHVDVRIRQLNHTLNHKSQILQLKGIGNVHSNAGFAMQKRFKKASLILNPSHVFDMFIMFVDRSIVYIFTS